MTLRRQKAAPSGQAKRAKPKSRAWRGRRNRFEKAQQRKIEKLLWTIVDLRMDLEVARLARIANHRTIAELRWAIHDLLVIFDGNPKVFTRDVLPRVEEIRLLAPPKPPDAGAAPVSPVPTTKLGPESPGSITLALPVQK